MRKAKATATKSERRDRTEKEKKPKVKKEKKPRRHFRFLPEGKTGDLWLILLTEGNVYKLCLRIYDFQDLAR